jgi:multidrug efflux pump subunit AcrB
LSAFWRCGTRLRPQAADQERDANYIPCHRSCGFNSFTTRVSTSSPGASLVIARFKVGTRQEDALVKVYSKIFANRDLLPQGASEPMIKERSIDDVPILSLTLWGKNYDAYHLRLIADELDDSIKQVKDVSETTIIGGQPRTMQVTLSEDRLTAYSLSPAMVIARLQAANARVQAGEFADSNREVLVDAGTFFQSKQDLEQVVVSVDRGHPVMLRDVASQIVDGPADPTNYVSFGVGSGSKSQVATQGEEFPAVTLTVAKRKGTNATDIANAVLAKIDGMRKTTLPADLNITTTRNYGATAKAKSDELLEHLLLATLSVTLLIALFLGWRESGVVLLAIPVTLALTLVAFYLYGYTLNRVTLFALIFSIGILVDDAIVVVENMVRHLRLEENSGRPLNCSDIDFYNSRLLSRVHGRRGQPCAALSVRAGAGTGYSETSRFPHHEEWWKQKSEAVDDPTLAPP